jgi:hypothetical protein
MSLFKCDGSTASQDEWEVRMDGVLAALSAMQARWQGVSVARSMTIKTLIDNLTEFAQNQFCYFHTSFTKNLVAKSNDFPAEYVYSITLAQIQHDIDLLQHVIDQRGWGDGVTRDTLLGNADRLAALALSPARKANLIEAGTAALTYFSKMPSIRVIPYAPIALIAVPYIALTSRRDYLAIPHEAGHYVFWHGKQGNIPVYRAAFEQLRDLLAGKIASDSAQFNTWFNWLGEVFADVYGCLVAGPVMATDFQELQKHTSREDFGRNDGDHPTPAVRPFIYHRALRQAAAGVGSSWSQQADDIQQEWLDYLNTRSAQSIDLLPVGWSSAVKTIPISDLIASATLPKEIDDLVSIALDLLKSVQRGDWTGDTTAADLYRVFEGDDQFSDTVTKGVPNETMQSFDWSQWKTKLDAATATWSVGSRPAWWWILVADGWTTEGPQQLWP